MSLATTYGAFLESIMERQAVEDFVTSMGRNVKDLQLVADNVWVIPNGDTDITVYADVRNFVHIAIYTKGGDFVDRASFRKIDNEWEEVDD